MSLNQNTPSYRLARGLGWFSLGLGALELVAPGAVARTFGLRERRSLIQGFGVREIMTGAGILLLRPTPWMWSRVAGDGLDLAALLLAVDRRNPRKGAALAGIVAVMGVTLLDYLCASSLSSQEAWRKQPRRDYSRRVGLAKPAQQMRGAAAGATSR